MKKDLEFNFLWNEPNSIGQLNPKDLHFFYYDVAAESLTNSPVLYEWNEKIEDFLSSNNMVIGDCEESLLQSKFFECNKMFFKIGNDETKPEAFFRHLRNAFAHFNVNHDGDFYYIKDYKPNSTTVTMIGKLKAQDLQQLCFLFFDQRENIIERLDPNKSKYE